MGTLQKGDKGSNDQLLLNKLPFFKMAVVKSTREDLIFLGNVTVHNVGKIYLVYYYSEAILEDLPSIELEDYML